MQRGATRKDVLTFAGENFGTTPEYPWAKYPDYAVLRNSNGKWYAILMSVPCDKLGVKGSGKKEIVNVKSSSADVDFLLKQKGFLPAYHMNKEGWISILLDGSVEKDLVFALLNESAALTQAGKKRLRTEPTDWLVPANPKYYDVVSAFEKSDTILWKQSSGVIAGDIIYLYVAAPYSAILYRCVAVETDIPYEYADENVRMKKVMKIKKLFRYGEADFTMKILNGYGVFYVRGPRGVPFGLRYALESKAETP